MSLSVLCVPHETSVMARKRHSRPAARARTPRARWAEGRNHRTHPNQASAHAANGTFTTLPVSRTARSGHSTTPTCRSQHTRRRERAVHDTTPCGSPPREPNWPAAPLNVLKGSFRAWAAGRVRRARLYALVNGTRHNDLTDATVLKEYVDL